MMSIEIMSEGTIGIFLVFPQAKIGVRVNEIIRVIIISGDLRRKEREPYH